MKSLPVTFFYPYSKEIETARSLDPDRDWSYLSTGTRIWILQTYLRLKQAGRNVNLSASLPARGIVVFHPYNRKAFERQGGYKNRNLLAVVALGDRVKHPPADVKIVQNSKYARPGHIFFIPCWPQPGLVPRNPARGEAVKTIAFKGYSQSLNAAFRSERWRNFLQTHGLTWIEDGLEWAGPNPQKISVTWNDYSTVDVLLAVRPNFNDRYFHKPASKLINAWLAGVPALLGPEYAYREFRRSDLDYIEVASLDEAINGVKMLIQNPARYRAMVTNGLRRAEEVTPARITQLWERVLFQDIPAAAQSWTFNLKKNLPTRLKTTLHKLRQRF